MSFMLCFLCNLPNFALVLWVLSLELSRVPLPKIDCDCSAAILILSNLSVVLHKKYFMSGDHFIILGCQKATFKKAGLGAPSYICQLVHVLLNC